jgi:KDO2-lipid IV(A) lauroyltransferase
MLKTVRDGGIIALMVDMSVRKQSVPVTFFGHRTRASHAAALLAARSKVTILPLFSYRGSDGRLTGHIGPPVPLVKSRNFKSDLRQNTQALTDIVEAMIRRHPDQYFWIQKRWKDYHPELYPGYRPRPGAFKD